MRLCTPNVIFTSCWTSRQKQNLHVSNTGNAHVKWGFHLNALIFRHLPKCTLIIGASILEIWSPNSSGMQIESFCSLVLSILTSHLLIFQSDLFFWPLLACPFRLSSHLPCSPPQAICPKFPFAGTQDSVWSKKKRVDATSLTVFWPRAFALCCTYLGDTTALLAPTQILPSRFSSRQVAPKKKMD